ncbi:MAG: sugar nucleotide-binding protein, partial [Spirochaetaceae bacterium]|nr:sugar nucleotide-binding protein [Spirochaetaceae bacterium]
DAEAVRATVGEFRPDLVLHAAAITSTEFSDANPELTRKINVDGAVNVGEAAQAVGARMIFFSTEQVFNGNTEPGTATSMQPIAE